MLNTRLDNSVQDGYALKRLRQDSGLAPLAHARGSVCANGTATVRKRSKSAQTRI